MPREFAIQEGVVCGKEFTGWQILIENVTEECLGLGAHGGVDVVTEEANEVGGDRHLTDVVEIQPKTNEILHETLRLRISQHAVHLRAQRGGLVQFSGSGERINSPIEF